MKNITTYTMIFIALHFTYGQSNILCNLEYDYIVNESRNRTENSSIQTRDNGEIIRFVEILMNKVKLPMNFHIRKCSNKRCRNNASASMDNNGTRFITYDNDWFDLITTDSTNIEVLVVLAHENRTSSFCSYLRFEQDKL